MPPNGRRPGAAWEGIALSLSGYEFHISSAPSTMPANFSYNNSHGWSYHGSEERFIAVVNIAPIPTAELNTRLTVLDQLASLNLPDDAKIYLAAGRERLAQELERRRK